MLQEKTKLLHIKKKWFTHISRLVLYSIDDMILL